MGRKRAVWALARKVATGTSKLDLTRLGMPWKAIPEAQTVFQNFPGSYPKRPRCLEQRWETSQRRLESSNCPIPLLLCRELRCPAAESRTRIRKGCALCRRPPGPACGKAWETSPRKLWLGKLRKQYWRLGAGSYKLFT